MDRLLIIFLMVLALAFFGFLFIVKIYLNSLLIVKQQKQILMELQQIKDDLQAANQKITESTEVVVKIDADVVSLHAKIDALPENPSEADVAAIAEIKQLAADLRQNTGALKDSLTAVDEKTADEAAPGGESDGQGESNGDEQGQP